MTVPEFLAYNDQDKLLSRWIKEKKIWSVILNRVSYDLDFPTLLMRICDKGWWKMVGRLFIFLNNENVNYSHDYCSDLQETIVGRRHMILRKQRPI